MSYARVLPRDLFNEGDLLNCLGRLWIKLDERPDHNAMIDGPVSNKDPFYIFQDASDGSIDVANVTLRIGKREELRLFRPLNSRERWPLWCRIDDEDVRVFDLDGELSPEFWVLISQPELVRWRRERGT